MFKLSQKGTLFNLKIETLAQNCINAIKNGNRIFCAGNGGSAMMSNHFCAELVGKFKQDRRALSAISLTNDIASITAIANDYSYSEVFTRQLEAHSKAGDIFITLSTSGKSENILKALKWAKNNGLVAVDFERIGDSTPEIQENQLVALHEVAKIIEEAFV